MFRFRCSFVTRTVLIAILAGLGLFFAVNASANQRYGFLMSLALFFDTVSEETDDDVDAAESKPGLQMLMSGAPIGAGRSVTAATMEIPAVTSSVTYDGNGNTGGTAPVDPNSPYNSGATAGVLGMGTLVRTGYQFSGWNTAANGSGTRYTPAQAFIVNANTTLFAQWTVPPCFTSGSLDPSFDGDGKVTTAVFGFDDEAFSTAIQPDGKIVAAGRSQNGPNYVFALVRYNANGSLDTTFDGDGKVTTAISSDDAAGAVAIDRKSTRLNSSHRL